MILQNYNGRQRWTGSENIGCQDTKEAHPGPPRSLASPPMWIEHMFVSSNVEQFQEE